MRLEPAYPPDTVTGACFVTGHWQLRPDEQVIDLDIYVDALPPLGRLVISEKAVEQFMNLLGWERADPKMESALEVALEEVELLRGQFDELVEAVEAMVNLPAVNRAIEVAARRVGSKDSLDEWLETLPKAGRR